jgi:DNA invertase Pin-like site-specific DNA recombinase
MAAIGYVRISTAAQNADLQRDALAVAGVTRVFEDLGVSGTVASRPGLDAALDFLREGDVLTVFRLDRLGRRTTQVLALLETLEQRGIGFASITEGLDTTTPIGKVVASLLAAFSQLERDVLVERTMHGLASARARGRIGGRPRALTDSQIELAQLMNRRGLSAVEIAAELGCGRSTAYRAIAAVA